MKKTLYISTFLVIIGLTLVWFSQRNSEDANHLHLNKVMNSLSQISTANYIITSSSYTPYDTVFPIYIEDAHIKEYVNSEDTLIGASYIRLNFDDPTKMAYSYDGQMRARVHWEEKTMEIDSFKSSRHPFRVVPGPFFTRIKTIVNYILETEDSISVITKDFGDSLLISLFVYDDVIEFLGKQIVNDTATGKISNYDLWVNKADYLPYRIKRNLPHNISIEACRSVKLNQDKISNFVASSYFPDYPLRQKRKQTNKNNLVGKVAPSWTLTDADNDSIALKDLKSKIILIQFTGIGCGPCHASISSLKELVEEYKDQDFELIGIETWSTNTSTIKRYQDKNELNYKFLKSKRDIKIKYGFTAVPRFYFLDQNRVIIKIIEGFRPGHTEKEIRNAIDELI